MGPAAVNVAVYQMVSRNNVLTHMGGALMRALVAQGVDAWLCSPATDTPAAQLVEVLTAAGTQAVVAFGSGGAEFCDENGVSAYDLARCGFVGWDVDHPSYHFPRFAMPIQRRGRICASESHLRFTRELGCRAEERLMLPGVDEIASDPLPIDARPIHVLAAISWMGEPEIWWNEAKGTIVYPLVENMVARALADPAADLLAAFEGALADLGLDAPLNGVTCALFANVGRFVRQYDRLRVAQALFALDVPAVLCGEVWRERLGERAHLFYAETLDYLDMGRLYGQARVVLNLNASNGASERAVMAMAAGAVVASDYSPLLEQAFHSRGALCFYDRRDPDSLVDLLASATGAAQQVADRGLAVAGEHLWSHKAVELIGLFRTLGSDAQVPREAAAQAA